MFRSIFFPAADDRLPVRTTSEAAERLVSCASSYSRLHAGVMALAVSLGGLAVSSTVNAAEPRRPECVAPAKPGGGFDLTCRLTQTSLKEGGVLKRPMRIVYMPGGVGAVAYNNIVAQRPDEGGAIVAFSGGSLLNLAQGKFGRYSVDDVRWLAAIGADYGVVVVRDDSAYQTLGALMEALKKDPSAVVFGTGGSVGSQDWMKAALTARAAGVDPRKMRFVAFEGGGEGITALRGNHVPRLRRSSKVGLPSRFLQSSIANACRGG